MTTALLIAACLLSLAALIAALLTLRAAGGRGAAEAHPEVLSRLHMAEQAVRDAPRDIRADLAGLKTELQQALAIHNQGIENRLGLFQQEQGAHLAGIRKEAADGRTRADEALAGQMRDFATGQSARLGETNAAMKELRERTEAAVAAMTVKLEAVNVDQGARGEALRTQMQANLDALREGNEKKLEEMRATVDEKLQGTLETRFNESFKLVSERLEQVHKGLGEMQSLATGVGDLKRVLVNVKSRGTWGEVQLGALLEDLLTPEQFERQVRVRPDSAEAVDYAVLLPGQNADGRVLLPIDCKYPQEDYERLLAAQEAADPAAVELAGKGLERALRIQAKSISEKYVHPPATTNFAILYLPTEGLFAEVVRRPSFAQELQQTHRITIAGPTTLSALLNSLRMGFTTLEIQKKSSEIATVLGQTKTAFERYGQALEAVDKKLDEAKKKVADVGVRHREITRKLRGVEAVALPGAPELALAPPAGEGEDEEAA